MSVRKIEGLVTEQVGPELLVFNAGRNEAHSLNATAALVFDLCDGVTSREAMATEIARRSGLPEDGEIVDYALAELRDAGLVEVDQPPPTSITRRSLLRRLGLTVITAAALPVVEMVAVPDAAQAQPVPQPPTPTPTPTPTP